MKRLLVVVPLLALIAAGCRSHTPIAPEDRASLEQTLAGPGASRYLRQSLYITPFFGDASRRLLTPYPPEDVDMLVVTDSPEEAVQAIVRCYDQISATNGRPPRRSKASRLGTAGTAEGTPAAPEKADGQ